MINQIIMLSTKVSRSWIFRICLIAVLFCSAQLSFAGDAVPILLPTDGTQPTPPVQPQMLTTEPSATGTISDTELAVYFDYTVGDATITVYDAANNVVCQQTVDTDVISAVSIALSSWATGNYMITVTYGNTTQRGHFSIE